MEQREREAAMRKENSRKVICPTPCLAPLFDLVVPRLRKVTCLAHCLAPCLAHGVQSI